MNRTTLYRLNKTNFKMKKIVTIALAAIMMLAGTNAFAQLSVGAGYLNSTLNKSYNGTALDPETSNGFYVGGSYNIHLVKGLGVAPGIYYSMLAGKSKTTYGGFTLADHTFTEHAINVPVNFNYGIDLRDVKFLVFAGPTFQYALSSQYKGQVLGVDHVVDSFKDMNHSPFNIYLGGGLGAELAEKLQITVGFDYGLMNISKADKTVAHRYNIKLGVAYLF